MRAAYIHGIRDIRIGEKPVPMPVGDEILLRVSAVGVCGSDLHYFKEGAIGHARITQPFIAGHEFAARVVDDHPTLGLKAGQLVAVDPAKPCGHCEWCQRGHVNLCPNVQFLGSPPHTHGAMTEYIVVSPGQVYPVPDHFTPVQAVMLEPLGVAIHAMDLAGSKKLFETVAIIGCGPIGLCLVQLARMLGKKAVYAIDPINYRTEKARQLGADQVAADHAAIAEWTGGRGVDLVLEATNAPEGFQIAAHAARIGGRVVLVGIPDGDQYAPLSASVLRRKGLDIRLSRRMGHVYERAIQLVAQGAVDVDCLVTHRFDLEQASEAFSYPAAFLDGALKTVVLPHPD
ncbi:alcohol dehydrogenase catalytic domain-containing protein [Pseudomonas sp. GD03842]|uniref:zinc-dependent alcohol dehydrogenase n=1 Tax=Pseudomonas sp. GD03842 TaxID=2975385 RepID=UPI0024493C34|nr:alcohol dehydrogenase catalytic domain-containing protein [Pseudomonas sp. GD03842]MDH0747124.1 alcohol dehydrogenase catalytic domain-containing protein [Pseudomonas sp. GD03842]